jgi:hypothetical protein
MQPPTIDTPERPEAPARRARGGPMTNLTNLTHQLDQLVEHERQETEVLTELNAALEAHCKAMNELADALAQVRRELFL